MKMEVKIQHSGRVEVFLNTYQSSNTRRNYRLALIDFFNSVYENAEPPRGMNTKHSQIEWLDVQAKRYFEKERDIKADVTRFFTTLNGLAPKTVRLKVAAVRVFLVENNVELNQKFWRRLTRKIKGSRALTLDKVPNNVELRKLIMHMPIHGKALYLMLASSGMRIGEALQLKLDDIINLDKDPLQIQIRGEYTKSGNSRYAFASREAKEATNEWLKVRKAYIQAAKRKSHMHKKEGEDSRLFPFENSVAYMVWRNALRKARMEERDKSTNFRKIHPHVLRKFFRTKMATLIPVDVVEALMGHEGYLTEVYRRYSVEDLAKFYLKGESSLLVFTEAEEVNKLRVEVEEGNKQLQTLVNGLTTENLELKSRMAKMELEDTDLKKRIQQTEKKLDALEKLIREALETAS